MQGAKSKKYNKKEEAHTSAMPIIEAPAKEKGSELVLDMVESGVVYCFPAVDMTDEVIKRYNTVKVVKK
jgi:Skp family chaperone for outer membrane proteins